MLKGFWQVPLTERAKEISAFVTPDVIVYSETWSEHVEIMCKLFEKLSDANFTVNLCKCGFGKATVTFLGHVVEQGNLKLAVRKVIVIWCFSYR